AGGGSLVVQVQLRRGDTLFVNDGVYGSLRDAGALGVRFPARRIRLGEADGSEPGLADFALFGPTCDSVDRMRGPFRLPIDMREGDWVELGQLGSYSACLRTQFNGFGRAELVEVADPPMLTTPGDEQPSRRSLNPAWPEPAERRQRPRRCAARPGLSGNNSAALPRIVHELPRPVGPAKPPNQRLVAIRRCGRGGSPRTRRGAPGKQDGSGRFCGPQRQRLRQNP